jgi:hypothetical protein
MMDVFELEYKEIKYNITNYKKEKMLKDMVGRLHSAFPNAQVLFKF